jgi:hypothetical protein
VNFQMIAPRFPEEIVTDIKTQKIIKWERK